MGARAVIRFFFTEVYNVAFLLPGQLLLGFLISSRQLIIGGLEYIDAQGEQNRTTVAKNKILYSILSFLATALALISAVLVFDSDFFSVVGSMLPAAVTFLGGWYLLTMSSMPEAVAAYSAFWMPPTEQVTHREDTLYALLQTRGVNRSRHAWGLLKSSPRAGLRERRRYMQLADAMEVRSGICGSEASSSR
ncbi:hypothetical protein [Streptomyces sp. CAI-85]|uniref:hypothetical protein n=1 Tax=Streptomyces sp. CAI-85 TaxID=1472662 RepID=UPI00158737AD|nr:hypothetical protein [Streptomyces sp. CAI-85]NUV64878.1 hypothetical protein [Streptomyces sp. CAI-85]